MNARRAPYEHQGYYYDPVLKIHWMTGAIATVIETHEKRKYAWVFHDEEYDDDHLRPATQEDYCRAPEAFQTIDMQIPESVKDRYLVLCLEAIV